MIAPPYVALEGIDGAGKSTQIEMLSQYLHRNAISHKVLSFTKKSDNAVGRIIRHIYDVDNRSTLCNILRKSESVKLALYAYNARINFHMDKSDIPRVRLIIGDRSNVTAYVFHQVLLKERPYLWCLEPQFTPQSVLFLDIDPKLAYLRIKQYRTNIGIDETQCMLEILHRRYHNLIRGDTPRYFKHIKWDVLNAGRSMEEVYSDVVTWIGGFLD